MWSVLIAWFGFHSIAWAVPPGTPYSPCLDMVGRWCTRADMWEGKKACCDDVDTGFYLECDIQPGQTYGKYTLGQCTTSDGGVAWCRPPLEPVGSDYCTPGLPVRFRCETG